MEGLETLEYRGYDSWGLVSVRGDTLDRLRGVGSVSRAHQTGIFGDGPHSNLAPANLALGHTRWATHGGVSEKNAHPHLSFDGRVAIVHNGVIENYLSLRRELEDEGVQLASETDSEVIAHLIARAAPEATSITTAIASVMQRLEGEYAVVCVTLDDPHAVYAFKYKSPLLFATGPEDTLIASDQLAAIAIGSEVTHLNDEDIVRATAGHATVFSAAGHQPTEVIRAAVLLDQSYTAPDKAGYAHYMLKEMHETPAAVRAGLELTDEQLAGVLPASSARLTLFGSGSAFYVARLGQYFFRTLAGIRADAVPSDEAAEWISFDDQDAAIAISQSGETFDTLEIGREAVERGAFLTSLANVPHSSLDRLSHHQLPQASGPEICVLSTKSIVSQVTILIRSALELGRRNGHLPPERYRTICDALERLPSALEHVLGHDKEQIQALAELHSEFEHWFFIGRGPYYPLALESALKFKEVSYRHAEGLPAGFFKHGTISLIDEEFFTVALLPSKLAAPRRFHATLANVSEIAARNGPVLAFGPAHLESDDLSNIRSYIALPYLEQDATDVIIQLLAGQLFAYHCAVSLGREIDQPRALAKSVTVR
jgi:glucosamine--fructose-6-phosphate aminotransferase (isomerizing)